MSVIRLNDAIVEPVTLDEAKAQCRATINTEDGLISSLIVAARQYCETYCQRAFINQKWRLAINGFSQCIYLPWPRLISIDQVNYVDSYGEWQTLGIEDYRVDNMGFLGAIYPVSSKSWPATDAINHSVTIEYTAGYGDTADTVPQAIKHAIQLLVGHWYENREAQIIGISAAQLEFSVHALLSPYRVLRAS